MLLALTHFGDCGLIRKLDAGGALVRARRYTVEKHSGCESDAEMCSASSLDPQCGSSAAECVEDDSCDAGGGGSLKDMLAGAPADEAGAPAPAPQEPPGDLEC